MLIASSEVMPELRPKIQCAWASLKPGTNVRPPRSIIRVFGPRSRSIDASDPTAAISSPRTATACARGCAGSIVSTVPPRKIVSAVSDGTTVFSTLNAETFVDDWFPAVIISFTFSSLPPALAGTMNERRAAPALNDSACLITTPATDGSHTILPTSNGAPARVTANDTVKRWPARGRTGTATGLPITGFIWIDSWKCSI